MSTHYARSIYNTWEHPVCYPILGEVIGKLCQEKKNEGKKFEFVDSLHPDARTMKEAHFFKEQSLGSKRSPDSFM